MRQLETKKAKRLLTGLVAALLSMLLILTAFAGTGYQLGETEKTWWDGDTVARWRKVDKAKKYQVRLYGDEDSIVRFTVTNTSADFSSYIEDDVEYYFEVRAVAKDSTQISGQWVASDSMIPTGRGDVDGHWRTYQQGKKYQKAEGGYAANEWYLISSEWYYFNEDGYMKTGWLQNDGKWYYLKSDGKMTKGWQQIDSVWYFMRADGSMATGWIQAKPGEWYYLYTDGKMAVNTVIDGCRLDNSGLWVQ